MKLTISMDYDAERDREGETAEDEQRLLDIVEEELRSYVESLRRRAEAEGLQVTVSTPQS